jgi:hypothetical protein
MRWGVALCLAGCLASFAPPAMGQQVEAEVAKAAEEAGKLAAGGRYIESLEALGEAASAVWDAAPLSFRKALFVAAQPGGFGVYQLRDGAAFKAGEQILIYAEPIGYGYAREGDLFVVDLVADVEVKNADGGVLGGQKGFTRFGLKSRVKNREFYAFITYTFSGLQPGSYVAATTLTDAASGKSGAFDLAFTIE